MKVKNNRIIKVLMFYDIKGWAWWHQINNIACNQPGDIKIDALKLSSDFNPEPYDYIVVFEAILRNVISKVPREKLIIGCNCPVLMEEFLKTLPIVKPLAGVVSNLEMYKSARALDNIFYCPNGVDEELFRPEINKSHGQK